MTAVLPACLIPPATSGPLPSGSVQRYPKASRSQARRRKFSLWNRYMSNFDKRQEGFEKKFALDEEQKFKAEARRNRLLGLWVAEKLGKTGDDAAAYSKEVVSADFEEAGDGDVLRKVAKDLEGKGVTEAEIRKKMDELVAVAVAQIKAGQ